MVPAPMYHTNGFATLLMLLAGDHLAVLEKFDATLFVDTIERYRITTSPPHRRCWRASRPCPTSGSEIYPASSRPAGRRGDATRAATYVVRAAQPEQMVTAYGMTENLGLTALRGDDG